MTHVQNIETAKIIKRLELIKSLIALEEESEINHHIVKLEQLALTSELKSIISMLQEKAYSKVVTAIENFINQHNQVSFYTNPKLEGLKLEAKVLETEITHLSDEKAELEKLIHEFGVRHNNELGELILKILRFKKSKARGTPKQEEAEKDFNQYSSEYEITKNEKIAKLTDEERKEIKEKFKKARKLCHPDVVREEQEELANKLFIELYIANDRNDLQRVREILENLERGDFFVSKSDAINEIQLMKSEIEKLRLRINELKEQVQGIKESEAFTTVSSIDDWDIYFKESIQKLAEQIKEFENAR